MPHQIPIRVLCFDLLSSVQIAATRYQSEGSFTLCDSRPKAARILRALIQTLNIAISTMNVKIATKATSMNIAASFAFFFPLIHVQLKCFTFLLSRISQFWRRTQRPSSDLLLLAGSWEHNPILPFQGKLCVVPSTRQHRLL